MHELNTPEKSRDGNQTLARGLRVLLAIADSSDGMTVHQVSEELQVHRSIAYRLLQTLANSGLVTRSRAGAYLPGARLATLAGAALPALREVAGPVMRALADRQQSMISIFVEEADSAVAIAMVAPMTGLHHISFTPGMRTRLTVGAAGYAILADGPPVAGEPEAVSHARVVGFASSHSEVEAGAYGVAAWIPLGSSPMRASLNLMTHRHEIALAAGPSLREAADEIGVLLRDLGYFDDAERND